MVIYNKLFKMLEKRNVTSYNIKHDNLFGQEILQKFRMCSVSEADREKYSDCSDDAEIITKKLEEYKNTKGKEFKTDVSTKTIESICQLLQCQPKDLLDWHVDLNPELAYTKPQKDSKKKA